MIARADRSFVYVIERRESSAAVPKPLHQTASLPAAQKFAARRLNRDATIVETEKLPLGCELIARVGTIDPMGRITWRRR